jgi:hypothetical protein
VYGGYDDAVFQLKISDFDRRKQSFVFHGSSF